MARRRRYNRKRRKGSFAFLYKLLAFVLICGAIGLALAMFFRIDDIEISGNSRYSNEQIAAAAQIKAGDNLFFLNKYDAAARIRQQLPYVETVQFRRVLPSKLVVQITECRDPVAIKQDGTVYLLCDRGNIVDTVSAAKWSQYIQIEGLTLLNPQVGSEARASATQQAVLDQLLAEGACFQKKDLAVNGRDMLELGLKGPEIGQALDRCLEAVLSERLPNEKAALLELVRR